MTFIITKSQKEHYILSKRFDVARLKKRFNFFNSRCTSFFSFYYHPSPISFHQKIIKHTEILQYWLVLSDAQIFHTLKFVSGLYFSFQYYFLSRICSSLHRKNYLEWIKNHKSWNKNISKNIRAQQKKNLEYGRS